jgi:hypothetical protein
MSQMWESARKRDGLPVIGLLLLVGWVLAMGLLVQSYRSPPLQVRASVEQKLERQGRFSPLVRRSVPLRATRAVNQ